MSDDPRGLTAADLIAQARDTGDPKESDRLAVQAILAAPALAEPYVHRCRLAARRGDVVAATHHARVAFSRGDRSPLVCTVLSGALAAAGKTDLAARIAAGAGGVSVPDADGFAELVTTQIAAVRGLLALPLPPKDAPALLPGEKAPTMSSTDAPVVGVQRTPNPSGSPGAAGAPSASGAPHPASPPLSVSAATGAPPRSAGLEAGPTRLPLPPLPGVPTRPGLPSRVEPGARAASPASGVVVKRAPSASGPPASGPPLSAPPAAVPARAHPASSPPAAAAPAQAPPAPTPSGGPQRTPPPSGSPQPVLIVDVATTVAPDWLEVQERAVGTVDVDTADWLSSPEEVLDRRSQVTGAMEAEVDGDAALELSWDPGVPSIAMKSPVTLKLIPPEYFEAERRLWPMPELGQTFDILEGRGAFVGLLEKDEHLHLAVRLPGPVLTLPDGQNRRLCERMVFGVSDQQVLLEDPDRPKAPPVRLPRDQIVAARGVGEDHQLSIVLRDGRQVHLDLRSLDDWGPGARRTVIVETAEALGLAD
jgi:hypothetical protein